MAKDWFSGGGSDWFTATSDDSSQSLKKRIKKLAEDQGIPEIGSEEWTTNLASEIDKQRQEKAKKDEEERLKAKHEAEVKAGKGHKNIFEKIGDAFEANSPQDQEKRKLKGEPEKYQDQQKQNKEAEDKGKAFDLTPDQIAERKDFYARQNFDLEKYAKTKDEYAVVHKGLEESKGNGTIFGKKKNSLKDVDLKSMAQKAEEEGLFAGNEEASKDLQWAKELDKEGSKMARTIYAQAIAKATKEVGMDDERKKIEGMYQTTKQQEKDGGGNIPQKIGRGFTTGFAESFVEVPSNVQSLASNALDIVAPEGSRVDKFAQERFTDAAKDNAGVKQEMKDKGLGPNEEGGFWSNLGQAGGSLAAAAAVGPGGAGAEAKGFWSSVKAFAKPSVVGTLFGVNKGGDIVRESRAAGNDPLEAGLVSGASAYAEGVLENFGLTKMFGRFGTGKITGMVGGAITEGSQEFLQDVATSTLQTTYKDVDWKQALGQALQSAEYGAILGGGTGVVTGGMEAKPKGVDQTLSEELQKQGVSPEDADAIGTKYAEDIKAKLTQVGEQAGELEDTQGTQGEDVPEVMTTKPQESGPSSIPGTNITDQPVTDQPTDVPVDDTTTPAPLGTPPSVEATDSAKDWEDNYADKYAELDNQVNTLDEQIKGTPKADQPPLKLQKDGLVAQQVQMEKEFQDKWKDKVNPDNPEENLKQAQPVQHKVGEDNLVSIDEKRLAESTASDNQYRKASYEEAVNMTGADAREVAKKAIRAYVHRGDSLDSLRAGQGGGTAQGGHYSIGGYLSSGKTTTHDIVVSLDDGREYKYKLKDIYDEVKAEPGAKPNGKPKKLGVINPIAEGTDNTKSSTTTTPRDEPFGNIGDVKVVHSGSNNNGWTKEGAEQQIAYWQKHNPEGNFKMVPHPGQIPGDKVFAIEVTKKSEVKGKPKKLGKPDATIKYPETKNLPENLKERVPIDDKQLQKDGKQVPKASDKLTPNEAQRVAEAPQFLRKSELATIIKLVPGLKDNPVFTVVERDQPGEYGGSRKALAIEYKSSDGTQTGHIFLNKIGISNERAEAIGLKKGMTVDLSEVMNTKAKGKVPVIRNNKTGQEANELEPVVETEGNSAAGYTPARTPQELEDRIDQLNKAGGKATVLRRGGLKSKKNAGVFQHPREKGTDARGVVKLQDKVIQDPVQYMRTLGHELSHAIENSINGNNHTTLKLFGELSKEETATINAELEAVSRKLIGDDVYDSKPEYYGKPTEQLARFVETLLTEPSSAESLAPTTLAKWEEAAVAHPQIAQFVEAVKGKMDNNSKLKVWSVWADLRQTFQKKLGKSLGTIAYNAEISRRAMHQYWQKEVAKTISEKFKGVKDDSALLMQSAESIKGVDEDGNLIFGTKDRMVARTAEEVDTLVEAGFELDNIIVNEQTNEKTAQMSRDRYTEEQGKQAFEDLTPEGQKLIRDFVGAKEDAKDLFNRDLLKEVFKIDGNIEGWVHRGLREKEKGKMNLTRKIKDLRERDAGMARKRKSVSDGYVKDFKSQMTKALLDAGEVDINNTFIAKQLARISKPIAKGSSPDKGWVEVIYDPRKGMTLPGEVGREKVTIETVMFDDTPEGFIDMNGKPMKIGEKSFLKPQNRYQVPKELAEYYRNIRTVPEEITVTRRVLENISKYWAINVLLHGGTVGTNFVGGGIQYTTKILDDFYGELLTGDVTMQKTRNNIAALVQVLTPKGWTEAPDYVYGGHYTNYAGQFMEKSKSESAIGKLGDYGLKPFSLVESYWKKVIMTAENKGGYSKVELSNQMKQFSQEEEAMLGAVNEIVDLYAYDYDNVPMWLATWSRKGGLIKPFMKYPYKYMKLVTNHASAVFDKSLPPQERVAKLLTLTTMVAAVLALDAWRDKEKETPEGSEKTPSSLDPRGRLMVWKNSTEEFFLRTAKYPFFNVASVGKAAIKGDWGTVGDVMADQLGTVGPFAKSILIGFGYTNDFEKYTPKDALIAQQMATFIPGFRVLNDVGKWIDTKPRLPGNFTQGIFNTLPVWGSDETKEKLRGKAKTLDIPVEPDSRSMSESSTYTKDLEIRRSDLLLSALTGIYLTRITPSEAQAQAMREYRNDTEKAVRELLKKHEFSEAQKLAGDAGLTIPPDSYSYYRRNYNPDGTKKKKSEE